MRKVLVVLLVLVSFFISCARDNIVTLAPGHLQVVQAGFPVSMDTTRSNDLASSMVNRQYAETLVMFATPAFDLVPHLAESWEMPDPQTLIMSLRQGVMFHNGDEMKASDVAFSLMRGVNSPTVRFILEMIESVDVLDDHTVQINLNVPFAPILGHLTHLGAAIVSERAVMEMGDDFANRPVGTGPFMVESMGLGEFVELVRHENYWGRLPEIERITIRTIPEAANRLIEIETGGAHIAMGIAPHNLPRLQADPNLDYFRIFALQMHHMGFNFRNPALADIRVRQAINYALDVPAIVETVFQGTGRPISGPMVGIPGSLTFDPHPFNVGRARELMAEAGFADGLTLSLWSNVANQVDTDQAIIIQNMLAEINIDVEIVAVEFATFASRTHAGDHDMYLHGWTNPPADPDYAMILFHSNSIYGTGNRMFYSNPEVDRLLDLGRMELDPARRLQLYEEAQQLIVADMPAVWILQSEALVSIAPGLRNFVNFPINTPRLWDITLPR